MSDLSVQKLSKPNGENQFIERVDEPGGDKFHIIDEGSIVIEGEDKINRYAAFLACIAGISGMLFGWDTAVISAALTNMGTDVGGRLLTATEQEWVTAALSCGALVGALAGGTLADIIGRKPVLIIGDVSFVVGGVLLCASYSIAQLCVARVIMGLGVGIAAVVCAVYIGELAPTKVRGRLVSIQSVMITGGQMIANAVSAGLQDVHGGWRILFAISIPVAILQGTAMHFLPESPRFNLVKGRTEEARATLQKIYRHASPEQVELKLKAIQLTAEVSQALKTKYPSVLKRLKILIVTPKYLRAVTVASGIFLFQQITGFNTLLYYDTTLFGAVGFNNPAAIGVLVSAVNCIFSGVSMFIMDRVGRRRILLVGLPVMLGAFIIACVAFYEMCKPTGGLLVTSMADTYDKTWVGLMLGMMVLFIAGYATSLGTIPYTVVELLPLEIRGMGAAIGVAFLWAGNILLSATYLTIMAAIGPAGAYGLYAGITFLALIFIYFTYPEVAGLSLEETGSIFDEGFGVRKAERLRKAHREADAAGPVAVEEKALRQF